MVADGHSAVVAGIVPVLTGAGFVVEATASTARDAVEAIRGAAPDVAVVDAATLAMTRDDLADACAHTRVVVFTADGTTAEALAAGAHAYVFKSHALDLLVEVVDTVAGGSSWVDPGAAARVIAHGAASAASLTAREREVLCLVADGHSYNEIGDTLSLAASTVQQHVRSAMTRLAADTRTQAVATALRLYLID